MLTLVAGGTYVLQPMGIERRAPLTVVRESVELIRRLWRGEPVSWQGKRFQLDNAQLSVRPANGRLDIPIWVAGRGPKMLQLAGRVADGVVLMVKSDLDAAIALVEAGSAGQPRRPQRIYLDRFAYTPALMASTASFFPHVIGDTPTRQLRGFLGEGEIERIRQKIEEEGPAAAAELITPQMLRGYKIAGTPEECSAQFATIVEKNGLNVFILNIVSGGLEANTKMMEDVLTILGQAGDGSPFIEFSKRSEEVRRVAREFNIEIDLETLVEDLSVGMQQKVEILKALYKGARLLVLDEPTSVLTPQESQDFFRMILELRDAGTTIIFITHNLTEAMQISDRSESDGARHSGQCVNAGRGAPIH